MRDQDKQAEGPAQTAAPLELQQAPVQFQMAPSLQSAELMGQAPPSDSGPAAAQSDNVINANTAVQATGGQPGGQGVHEVAQQGVAGSGGSLPHLGQIQSAFGQHDVSGVNAHVGGAAADASNALGAQAYASGNDVAFKSQPDLHTAAHEAAHVVQQRGGVQLKDGVGQSGDAYERQADAVADAVVSGQNAEGILSGRETNASGPPTLQAYAGDVTNAHDASKNDGSTVDVAAARNKEHHPDQSNDEANQNYDANQNNKLKVEFEVALAKSLLVNNKPYRAVCGTITKGVKLYIEAEAEKAHAKTGAKVQATSEMAYKKMHMMHGANHKELLPDTFYGRLVDADPKDQTAMKGYFGKMEDLLNGIESATIGNHLLLHQSFNEYVNRGGQDGDKAGDGDLLQRVAQKVEQEAAANEGEKTPEQEILSQAGSDTSGDATPTGLRDDRYDSKNPGKKGAIGKDRTARGRVKAGQLDPETQDEGDTAISGPGLRAYDAKTKGEMSNTKRQGMVGIQDDTAAAGAEGQALTKEEEKAGLGEKGSRGIEMYMLDESQKFIQDARIKYDMPLAAGISGTTTDLLEVALMFGVKSDTDKLMYTLGILGHLGSIGAHSFHEIMSSAAKAGVKYDPGNYRSIMAALTGHPAKELFDDPKYKDVPGIGK